MTGPQKIILWRIGLGAISLLNLALWLFSRGAAADAYGYRQWILAGVFAAVCAFRSILPRIDLERYVLVDHWLSSIFIGRSLATVAELAFAAQCALALREIGVQAGLPALGNVALLVVPLLALAQLFCWYSVATLNHGGHAVEESLWTFTHGMIGVCLIFAWPRVEGSLRFFVGAGILVAAGFVAFMTSVDVPMYIRRWKAGRVSGAAYLPLGRGLADALERRIVARRWEDWREEVAWLSLYFSVAVWISLAMIRLPR